MISKNNFSLIILLLTTTCFVTTNQGMKENKTRFYFGSFINDFSSPDENYERPFIDPTSPSDSNFTSPFEEDEDIIKAAKENDVEYFEILKEKIDHHALKNLINTKSDKLSEKKALHIAAEEGYLELVKFLLYQCNADPFVTDFYNQTPYNLARYQDPKNANVYEKIIKHFELVIPFYKQKSLYQKPVEKYESNTSSPKNNLKIMEEKKDSNFFDCSDEERRKMLEDLEKIRKRR